MLSWETVGVLGALFGLLVYGMVRAQLAKSRDTRVGKKMEEQATGAPEDVL
jgi:uncharacterized protein (DUF2062 family)